ncbi:MAG: hypothetical protein ACRCWR_05370, partial [Saezia sp.]
MKQLLHFFEFLANTPPSNDGAILAQLMDYLRPTKNMSRQSVQVQARNVLVVLEGHPEWAHALGEHLSIILAERRHRFFYAESGILEGTSFFTEFSRRVGQKWLPPALDDRFLRDLIEEAFDRGMDVRWLIGVPHDIWLEFFKLIGFTNSQSCAGLMQAKEEMIESLRILGHRLAAIGLEPDLVRYYAPLVQYESPFIGLQRELEAVAHQLLQCMVDPEATADAKHVEVLIEQCEVAIEKIRKQAREDGVTIRLTWHLLRVS